MKKLLSILLITSFSNTVSQSTSNQEPFLNPDHVIQSGDKPLPEREIRGDSTEVQTFAEVSNSISENKNEISVFPLKPFFSENLANDPGFNETMEMIVAMDSIKALRDSIMNVAVAYLGLPYRWGGETTKGFDCSAFVRHVYEISGIELPRTSQFQSEIGNTIPLEQAKTGDIIYFGHKTKEGYRTKHLAIIIKKEKNGFNMIHASKRGVIIDDSESKTWASYYKKRFLFVKRVIGGQEQSDYTNSLAFNAAM